MTGQQLILWIKENKAEDLDLFVIDVGFAIMDISEPSLVENTKLCHYHANNYLDENKRSVVVYGYYDT